MSHQDNLTMRRSRQQQQQQSSSSSSPSFKRRQDHSPPGSRHHHHHLGSSSSLMMDEEQPQLLLQQVTSNNEASSPPVSPSANRRLSSLSLGPNNNNHHQRGKKSLPVLALSVTLFLLVGMGTIGSVSQRRGYDSQGRINGSRRRLRVKQHQQERLYRKQQRGAAATVDIDTASPAAVTDTTGPVLFLDIPSDISNQLLEDSLQLTLDNSNLQSVEDFISKSRDMIRTHVPSYIHDVLHQLHSDDYQYSAVMIRGLPVDPVVPPTPTDRKTLLKSTFVSEAMLVGFGEETGGQVVGYASEINYSNPWIHEGFPRLSQEGSALTAATALSFHQDMSYMEHAPTILGLSCVREGHDHQVQTTILDNREIVQLLPPKATDILKQDRFLIKTSDWVDQSQLDADHHIQGRPLLHGMSNLHLPVDHDNMMVATAEDTEAQWALQLLKDALEKAPVHPVHFEEGDLLLFNNVRVVHGRTPYLDLRYDGGDRVMNRSYFRKGLTPKERNARMI